MRFTDTRITRLFVPAMPLLDRVVEQIGAIESCCLVLDSAIPQGHTAPTY